MNVSVAPAIAPAANGPARQARADRDDRSALEFNSALDKPRRHEKPDNRHAPTEDGEPAATPPAATLGRGFPAGDDPMEALGEVATQSDAPPDGEETDERTEEDPIDALMAALIGPARQDGPAAGTAENPPEADTRPDAGDDAAETERADGNDGAPVDDSGPVASPALATAMASIQQGPQAGPDAPRMNEARPEPARPAIATAAGGSSTANLDTSADNGADTGPGSDRRGTQQQPLPQIRTETASPRVDVVQSQTLPSPGPVSDTARGLVGALSADAELASIMREAAALARPAETGGTLHMLKIQLHPAELGTVTARLAAVGDQLMVDLQVENGEARQRLHADSDSIVKSLRALGFEIDRVTVQQSLTTGQGANAGTDQQRSPDFTGQQRNEANREGDRQPRRDNGQSFGEHANAGSAPAASGAAGGVYI